MTDVKQNVAKNLTALRQQNKMTQIELAEKLNYSDKAVSKWERGESIPDVMVLKTIADLFGVSLDYLLEEVHETPTVTTQANPNRKQRNRKVITILSVSLVWLIATLAFVALEAVRPRLSAIWLPFIYGVPITAIVWLVFNSLWFNKRRNYLIISVLMWSVLVSIFLSMFAIGYIKWTLFLLGVPGQFGIYVWSCFQRKNHPQ